MEQTQKRRFSAEDLRTASFHSQKEFSFLGRLPILLSPSLNYDCASPKELSLSSFVFWQEFHLHSRVYPLSQLHRRRGDEESLHYLLPVTDNETGSDSCERTSVQTFNHCHSPIFLIPQRPNKSSSTNFLIFVELVTQKHTNEAPRANWRSGSRSNVRSGRVGYLFRQEFVKSHKKYRTLQKAQYCKDDLLRKREIKENTTKMITEK